MTGFMDLDESRRYRTKENALCWHLNNGYQKYVAAKLGLPQSDDCLSGILKFGEAAAAAQILANEYDLGIELARDGLLLGYIFNLHGLPTKAVKLGRRGRGATWRPLEDIMPEDLKNKKLIVFDNDAVTGRTLRRTVKELSKFAPAYMDLFLVMNYTPVSPKKYEDWRKRGYLPSALELFKKDLPNLDIIDCQFAGDVYRITYCEKNGYGCKRVSERDLIGLDTRTNVPPGFRKIMTLDDFEKSYGSLLKLEEILKSQTR